MADSKEAEKPESETPEVKAPAPTVIYLLKSVVRSRFNRTARVAQPGRMPFVQRLAGGTIIVRRARPARISEAALKANLDEIKKAVAQCRLEVTTLSGQHVDLDTLGVGPALPAKPMPNPPLDSAKNDKNQGIGYDVPPTPEGTTMSAPLPKLLEGTQVANVVEDPPHAPPPAPPVVSEEPKPEEPPAPEAKPALLEPKKDFKSKGKRG